MQLARRLLLPADAASVSQRPSSVHCIAAGHVSICNLHWGITVAGVAFLRHCSDAQKQFYNAQLTEHGHKLAWRLPLLPADDDACSADDLGSHPPPAAAGLKERPQPRPRIYRFDK